MKPITRALIAVITLLLAAAHNAAAQSDVIVEVDQFGVGSQFRAGDMTGVRLKLTSQLAEPIPAWVQWEVPNVDGDIMEIGRSLTLTPNVPALTWLYAPLPPDATLSSVWTVRVFEERDGERRGEIGAARIGPARASSLEVSPGTSMIAVVGDRRMGLDGYSLVAVGSTRVQNAHEDTRVASGIKAAQLPDRWFGLLPYEAVVWSGDTASPHDLSIDQAEALRDYIWRGGHLIIVLPAAGNPWGLGAIGQIQLEDILPCRTPGQTPRVDEAAPLASLLPVLSKSLDVQRISGGRFVPEFSIRVFKDLKGDFNVLDNYYEPFIALPDGRVVAIQRLFGHGRVTVIGIDLADGRFLGLELPQADAFWNRVLGRRSDTPTPSELSTLASQNRLGTGLTGGFNLGSGNLFSSQLDFPTKAGVGLLLALLLFATYWAIAGPLGFGLLKYYKQQKHSWLAFTAASALFTAIAWGSVGLLPKQLEVKHVTYLDHIAQAPGEARREEQLQRAVSYMSVLLPQYDATPIAIDSLRGQRDLLHSWTPPPIPPPAFPNVDRYRVDIARQPAGFVTPARATATHLYAHWMGALDRDAWGGMLRVDPNDPIRVVPNPTGLGDALAGSIINDLPGTLTNVTVIWVDNARLQRRAYQVLNGMEQPSVPLARSGEMLNRTMIWRLTADRATKWAPGQAFRLSDLGSAGRFDADTAKRYNEQYTGRNFMNMTSAGVSLNDTQRRDFMEMMCFFNQLAPPIYLKEPGTAQSPETIAFSRDLGREFDLSAWFSRPCVIIIGFLERSPCPIPLRVAGDDEPPPSDGLTVVRWIYPLPLDEKVAFQEVFQERIE